jgi:hypothetical protein
MTKQVVFISHSERDSDLAEKVGTALEECGLEALLPTEDRKKSVQDAIRRSDALIMLAVTPQYLSSSWASYETGVAAALGKRVMVLVPNKYPVTELPPEVASDERVDFDPQAPERAARDIASRLTSPSA